MRFVDLKHKAGFEAAMCKYNVDPRNNSAGATIYLLTATHDCRQNLDDIIDYDGTMSVRKDALKHDWVTGGDARIIRLALNLFTAEAATAITWDSKRERYRADYTKVREYLPLSIFCGLDKILFEAALEAIRLRCRGMTSAEDEFISDCL